MGVHKGKAARAAKPPPPSTPTRAAARSHGYAASLQKKLGGIRHSIHGFLGGLHRDIGGHQERRRLVHAAKQDTVAMGKFLLEFLSLLMVRFLEGAVRFIAHLVAGAEMLVGMLVVGFVWQEVVYLFLKFSKFFGLAFKYVLMVFKIVAEAFNDVEGVVGGAVNGIAKGIGALTGHHVHHVSLPKIPISTIDKLEPWAADIERAGTACPVFGVWWNMVAFIPRALLNSYVCPIWRFVWPAPPLRWALWPIFFWLSYDAAPIQSANCAWLDDATLCFGLDFGHFMLHWLLPFTLLMMALHAWWPALKQCLELAWFLAAVVVAWLRFRVALVFLFFGAVGTHGKSRRRAEAALKERIQKHVRALVKDIEG